MSSDVLNRIMSFERDSVALAADEVTSIHAGYVARTPSLPAVWSLNYVGVTRQIAFPQAVGLANLYMRDLPYRQLFLEHEPGAEALARELLRDGWKIESNLHMVLRQAPDRELDTSPVIEPSEEDALELMRRWTGEDELLRASPDAHEQVVDSYRRLWRARHARRLGVLGRDGALAGITLVFSDSTVGQVEDVYVVPEERGRGFGRVLVTHGTRLAVEMGHELVFIVADLNGWPKQLYAKVGFEPTGRTWACHRGAIPGG